jgi:RND family efflux transporter MFP subunit
MKYRVGMGLAALLLVGGLAGCTRQVQGAGDNHPQAMPVKIEVAQLHPAAEFSEYMATLRSRRAAVLRPDVEGQITRILVRSGDRVKPGMPLLEIDPQKQQATLTSQQANQRSRLAALEYNRSELERRKQLHAAGVISRQELEQAQSAYDASKADVDALEASVHEQQVQLHYHVVKAPADGTIGDIPVRVGDRVKSDTMLTTLDQGGELEAYISIPAELAPRVRLGTPVEIVEDGRPTMRVAVSFVSPRVDTQNQLLLIKAMVPNAQQHFRNEQLVHAHVIWAETQRPLIPVTAVSRLSGQTFAFVVEGTGAQAVARQRTIRTGDMLGNSYVVLDGIKPGDKIITTGVQLLVDGVPVAPETGSRL